jgi:glutamyl-tRNA reductase
MHLSQLHEHSILIVALGEGASPIHTDALPAHVTTIDLSVPQVVESATMTLREVVDRSRGMLQPQRDAVERASHRLKARAEAALAETLCPAMKAINESIAHFRQAIIDAEYRRLASSFEKMPAEEAQHMRRSIRHTAARCVHPIHEYVNALGRQSRVDEARTVVDHLLGTRVGVMIESECETRRRSPGIGVLGFDAPDHARRGIAHTMKLAVAATVNRHANAGWVSMPKVSSTAARRPGP